MPEPPQYSALDLWMYGQEVLLAARTLQAHLWDAKEDNIDRRDLVAAVVQIDRLLSRLYSLPPEFTDIPHREQKGFVDDIPF